MTKQTQRNGMEEVLIFRFQLEAIENALRVTANIHNSRERKTCHDRMVAQSEIYAQNALAGEKEKEVGWMSDDGLKQTTPDFELHDELCAARFMGRCDCTASIGKRFA